ncbi:flagellar biosynthetic protein FliO [Endozoicomonas sp. SESOKO1]|uniref:flagellar biosynthetic protein FliO n=1 Tax=Endozoicomonas sp. SESOKO1 TaxID=2828742 RepID=UPI002148FC13|nr:flagellar biosynthetic protein FliO [Endozoicomonas sp. SESOKO1]
MQQNITKSEACTLSKEGLIVISMKQLLKYHAFLLLLPTSLMAETAEPASPISELDLFQVVMPMLMVVSLIFVLAWLVKRFNPKLPAMGKDIELLSSAPLSNQTRLTLVRVCGKDLLIGITPGQITLLKDFDAPVVDRSHVKGQADLAEQFKKLLRSKPDGDNSSEKADL